MDMGELAAALVHKSTGTYYDKQHGEYVLILGGVKVGTYLDTGNKEHNAWVDREMWTDVFRFIGGAKI